MVRLPTLYLLVFSTLACAQSPADLFRRAPAGIEEPLRKTVDEFYQMQMDGKFRPAEKLVCEDSQDAYYNSDKVRWKSRELVRINFKDDFKTADVVMALGSEMVSPMGRIPVTPVITSTWKAREGGWCYYIPPVDQKVVETPFGKMSSPPAPDGAGSGPGGMPAKPIIDVQSVMSAVRVSRSELRVKGYEASTDQVEISNGMPGPVDLALEAAPMKGLKIELSSDKLQGSEKGVLKVTHDPADKSPKSTQKFALTVQPSNQRIEFTLYFDVPKEAIDQLPEALRPKQ
jgi:hypothetical protein